jgi:hypothetical protein
MGPEQTRREWLESLDPAEFQEIARTISDIERDRREVTRVNRAGRVVGSS